MKSELYFKINELTDAELISGVRPFSEKFICVICGRVFEKGVIFSVEERLVDAERAVSRHVEVEHGGMLRVLIELPGTVSGLSELQCRIFELMGKGRSDREIAGELGGKAESTIRNHRFQFRRRLMEARIMVAIGKLLARKEEYEQGFIQFHKSLPVHDERVMTTQEEADKILSRCLKEDGQLKLTKFPRKEKEKLVVLRRIMGSFDAKRRYTEKEINAILQPIYDDYVTVRRYLIEYCFLGRKPDGSEYWINK